MRGAIVLALLAAPLAQAAPPSPVSSDVVAPFNALPPFAVVPAFGDLIPSAGCSVNAFSNAVASVSGSLVASAVLIRTAPVPFGFTGFAITNVQLLVKLKAPESTLNGYQIAIYANPKGSKGPGEMIGSPVTVVYSAVPGVLSTDYFTWVTLDVSSNNWGPLLPKTRYWVGFLPGSTTSTANQGIFLGSTAKSYNDLIPVHGGILQTATLFSAYSATDAANGCGQAGALSYLSAATNWQDSGSRFTPAGSKRHFITGLQLVGNPA